jgi:cellulose synthase/poly-beta-1,6-N-acetylglucosamine synthase-like glycosyltransferase
MQFIKFKINVTFFKRNNKVKLIVKLINIIIELIIIEYINIIIANEKEIFKKEIKSIKNYYNLCNEGKLINNKIKFRKKNHPKVSLVIALYNKEKYLLRLLRSIQNQYFKDIEIIFVDDFSTDNGINLLKSFQKEDKRINIIRNKRNKGTLISRIIGIFKTKGDYIMVPDADDMIAKDIIKTCYDLAVKYIMK